MCVCVCGGGELKASDLECRSDPTCSAYDCEFTSSSIASMHGVRQQNQKLSCLCTCLSWVLKPSKLNSGFSLYIKALLYST